jgi:hypothetical protein
MKKLITKLIMSSLLAGYAITASATTINVVGTLINQPSQFDFPATFPFADQITGSFTFADPLPGDYDGASDNFPGANISQFDNIASFSLSLDTYGAITGTNGQVTTQNLATERFQIGAGALGFGGTVTGANVPTTGGSAELQAVFLIVESSNDLLTSQNATDAANALVNNLAGWDVRTDRQIRLSFIDPNAPNVPIEVDYQLTAVPVPPAVWLFGSGLLGLVGIARRKKA